MKKLLLVAMLVAVPALVLAQGAPTTSTGAAKTAGQAVVTTKAPAPEAAKPVAEAVKTLTASETLSGEIADLDTVSRTITFKTKSGNVERLTYSSNYTLPTFCKKGATNVNAICKKDPAGKWMVEKLEQPTAH